MLIHFRYFSKEVKNAGKLLHMTTANCWLKVQTSQWHFHREASSSSLCIWKRKEDEIYPMWCETFSLTCSRFKSNYFLNEIKTIPLWPYAFHHIIRWWWTTMKWMNSATLTIRFCLSLHFWLLNQFEQLYYTFICYHSLTPLSLSINFEGQKVLFVTFSINLT